MGDGFFGGVNGKLSLSSPPLPSSVGVFCCVMTIEQSFSMAVLQGGLGSLLGMGGG